MSPKKEENEKNDREAMKLLNIKIMLHNSPEQKKDLSPQIESSPLVTKG